MSVATGLLGKKLGMTQVFQANGRLEGVTALQVGPCVVVQKRTMEKDGYTALQLGFEEKAERKVTRPMMGHFAKAGVKPQRYVREFRVPEEVLNQFEVGQVIGASAFVVGQIIDIAATSRGMGFQGVMKRYNFSGAKASHGVHEFFRHGGSLGTNMTPGRVFKGRKMPGHMGHARVTMQNVEVVRVFAEDNIIFVKGPVPGAKNSMCELFPAIKVKTRKRNANPIVTQAKAPQKKK